MSNLSGSSCYSLAGWLLIASALHMTTAGPPVFGTKRYTRGWTGVSPYYGGVRVVAPYYATDYDLDYYYQDPPYPAYSYYPSPSPYYRPYPYYGYEDPLTEPVEEEHADYGMETWYDNHAAEQDSNARANAMFLQNLILANMANDQNNYKQQYRPLHTYLPKTDEDGYEDGTWVYGEPVRSANGASGVSKEDEDVRELKELVNKKKARKEELFREQLEGGKKWQRKRSDDNLIGMTSTTENPVSLRKQEKMGQMEVVLPRPANPPRNALNFHKTVVSSRSTHKPSVYDTIKQLLQMQERLQGDEEPEKKSKPQKRSYVPSEESLVAQLGGLKKMAA